MGNVWFSTNVLHGIVLSHFIQSCVSLYHLYFWDSRYSKENTHILIDCWMVWKINFGLFFYKHCQNWKLLAMLWYLWISLIVLTVNITCEYCYDSHCYHITCMTNGYLIIVFLICNQLCHHFGVCILVPLLNTITFIEMLLLLLLLI